MAPKIKKKKKPKTKSRSGTSCAEMQRTLRAQLAEATTQLTTLTVFASALKLDLTNSRAQVIALEAELVSSNANVAQLNRDLRDERDRRQEIIDSKMDMISKVHAGKPKLFDKPTSARTSGLGSVDLSVNRLLQTPKRKATRR